jgi:hypothetical protein
VGYAMAAKKSISYAQLSDRYNKLLEAKEGKTM